MNLKKTFAVYRKRDPESLKRQNDKALKTTNYRGMVLCCEELSNQVRGRITKPQIVTVIGLLLCGLACVSA